MTQNKPTQYQISRIVRSEHLLGAHINRMRKPVPNSIKRKQALQAKLIEIDKKLGALADKVWHFLTKTTQP